MSESWYWFDGDRWIVSDGEFLMLIFTEFSREEGIFRYGESCIDFLIDSRRPGVEMDRRDFISRA